MQEKLVTAPAIKSTTYINRTLHVNYQEYTVQSSNCWMDFFILASSQFIRGRRLCEKFFDELNNRSAQRRGSGRHYGAQAPIPTQ